MDYNELHNYLHRLLYMKFLDSRLFKAAQSYVNLSPLIKLYKVEDTKIKSLVPQTQFHLIMPHYSSDRMRKALVHKVKNELHLD